MNIKFTHTGFRHVDPPNTFPTFNDYLALAVKRRVAEAAVMNSAFHEDAGRYGGLTMAEIFGVKA